MGKDEAARSMLTLVCMRCGNVHEAQADAAIEDPSTGEWFGVCDEAGKCQQCGSENWRYDR
jgi:hypothetical protein